MTPYYSDEAIDLYLGDNREVLPALGVVAEHVITDAPYDPETHEGQRSHGKRKSNIEFEPIEPEDVVRLVSPFARRWCINFCSMESLGFYRRAVRETMMGRWVRSGFWHRPDGSPQFTGDRPAQPGEGIAIWHGAGGMRWNAHGKRAYYRHGVVRGDDKTHETPKPIGLMIDLVGDFTEPGDLIVDPFAGSGTTGAAAKALGRKAILIERRERDCENAARRFSSSLPFTFGDD